MLNRSFSLTTQSRPRPHQSTVLLLFTLLFLFLLLLQLFFLKLVHWYNACAISQCKPRTAA